MASAKHPTRIPSLSIGDRDLDLATLRRVYQQPVRLTLTSSAIAAVKRSVKIVDHVIESGQTAYGINTGFGLLAQTRIPKEDLRTLQRNIVLSHAAGTGALLPDEVVRVILVLKIASLAQGYSGIRLETLQALMALLEHEVYPCIPGQGSVGASGDLAPLAHLVAVLLGVGEARVGGKIVSAKKALKVAGLEPIELGPKEGLALLNGTQVSTALALVGLLKIEDVYAGAVVAGALSVDALKGSDAPFDARIHLLRRQPGQSDIAAIYRRLLAGSAIRQSHADCERVQDPYSLRCQPQVMGACLDVMRSAATVLVREANAVTDNPLIFPVEGDVLSGGNFHAEPVAFAADHLALAVCEMASLSERRLAILVDPKMSGLPAFLVENSGLNSGFMLAQVTAAALVSENKCLAHPSSVDSIPTSANQEDHVSMATYAARRLTQMAENSATVVAIELLASAQGIGFHRPHQSSEVLEACRDIIRTRVSTYSKDRYFAPDIEAIKRLVLDGTFVPAIGAIGLSS